MWHCEVAYVLNVQKAQRQFTERQAEALRQNAAGGQPQDAKSAESLKPTEAITPAAQKSETTRRRLEIPPHQTNQKSKGMRV